VPSSSSSLASVASSRSKANRTTSSTRAVKTALSACLAAPLMGGGDDRSRLHPRLGRPVGPAYTKAAGTDQRPCGVLIGANADNTERIYRNTHGR
jgi:hypothetical protein